MNIFQSKIQQHQTTILQLTSVSSRLSVLRLVAFVCSLVLIVYLANERLTILLLIIVPICGLSFGLLIKRYNRVAYLKRHTNFLKEINESEVLKLENQLVGFPAGQAFIRRNHPYVADLDIFGPHSLFQLLNRTTTESGSICLAKWLSEPAATDVILERQQAIPELTPKLEWRQDFQASGTHFKNTKSDYNKLLAWIEKPVELLPHQTKYLIAGVLLSLLSTSTAIYYVIQVFSSEYITYLFPLLLILFVNILLLRKVAPLAEELIDSTHENVKVLGGYEALIKKIEPEQFDAPILQRLQSTFSQHSYSAASEINKLKKILEVFQLRGTKEAAVESNKFYVVFNVFWLLDIYWIILTERWKRRNTSYIEAWASAVSEFEVLNSLAGFSYANPSFVFPEIRKEPYVIQFEMLGHPLISEEKRVCNHFNVKSRGEIAMITGSNMAGKSTFLRTVGVNLVLALMGAPCCAASVQVSNMKLFTSMRTQDNLEEGTSSFYAELKRIEQLLSLLESKQTVFFLLDEMFKGTNSQDRYKGGVSLIKQLSELNAFGMISTHDLELAKLAGNHMNVVNYSFNSKIQHGEMTFNYELTPGICRDFNASELMKKSGIKILSNDRD